MKLIRASSGMSSVENVANHPVQEFHSKSQIPKDDEEQPPSRSVKTDEELSSRSKRSNTEKVLHDQGYKIVTSIGRGSYASVKLAESIRQENMFVAVKIISKSNAPHEYVNKFLPREVSVVKGLRHKNIIHFIMAIETTLRVFIVMEHAENGTLLELIRRESCLDETRAKKWFQQLVEAIDYCHARGVVHRDVKCENILLDSKFDVKLSDFGFAKSDPNGKDGNWSLSSTFCGSLSYAAPEILRGQCYLPNLADIWSTGIVLYAMIFGSLPFDGTKYRKLVKQHDKLITFPRSPVTSLEVKRLILNILTVPGKRPQLKTILENSWFRKPSNTNVVSFPVHVRVGAPAKSNSDPERLIFPEMEWITRQSYNEVTFPGIS